MVAGGHVLPPPLESVCSGVVSLRSIRLICFIAELNSLDLCQGDISNACLESHCTELLAFTAGPEFGELGYSVCRRRQLQCIWEFVRVSYRFRIPYFFGLSLLEVLR